MNSKHQGLINAFCAWQGITVTATQVVTRGGLTTVVATRDDGRRDFGVHRAPR